MITTRLVGCSLAALITLCSAVSAQQPSDLLRIKKTPTGNDKLGAQVSLLTGKGGNMEAGILGTSQVINLPAIAYLSSFIATPIFDSDEFPDGALERHLVFAPVTLARGQEFLGLVGVGGEPNEPGFDEDEFRNAIFDDYEVEVDGITVRADAFEVGPAFPIETDHGTEMFTYFNYTQKLLQRGTHRITYRFTNRKTLGDCSRDCLPAGKWIFDFTVTITTAGTARTETAPNDGLAFRFPRLPGGGLELDGSEPR